MSDTRIDAPQLMGILNCTPDSFHAGGRTMDVAAAIAHGVRMRGEGTWAELIRLRFELACRKAGLTRERTVLDVSRFGAPASRSQLALFDPPEPASACGLPRTGRTG